MELTAGLGSVDDYIRYIEAGADECFCGYIPYAWDVFIPYVKLIIDYL